MGIDEKRLQTLERLVRRSCPLRRAGSSVSRENARALLDTLLEQSWNETARQHYR